MAMDFCNFLLWRHRMKSLMRLLECVLADASIWCSTSTTRDFKTVTRRVKHEGISFLTISLPVFCSDFERSLADSRVAPSLFLGFKKRGVLPVFLRGLLERVFDASTGTLLEDPDVHAIYAVRQVCLLCKKVLLTCSTERERKAYAGYLETDDSVRSFHQSQYSSSAHALVDSGFDGSLHANLSSESHRRDVLLQGSASRFAPRRDGLDDGSLLLFRGVSGLLWSSVLQRLSNRVDARELTPKHGPGATADRISGNQKFTIKRWHQRLDLHFPSDLYILPNQGYVDDLRDVDFVCPEQEHPVRVISVPKTLKTPRIIAMEPLCMQYAQQAILGDMVNDIESHPLTRGRINFSDQTINQSLALSSSRDGSLATIDLKDASDRVSSLLVYDMLASVPSLRDAIFACRSTRADVPGLGVKPLARFASMGSALCFPIEAMVFYTIILTAILKSTGLQLTPRNLSRVSKGVRVYGDDIIVPVEYVQSVKSELERFNLRVNSNKTFGTGKFRESCGVDAYDGVRVTPVYVRRLLPTSRRNAEELMSAISLGNQFYEAGYWRSATYVRQVVEHIASVPYVSKNSSVLGWHSYTVGYEVHGWDRHLHKWLVKGLVVATKARHDPLEGHGALLKHFLKRAGEPYVDKKHLERYGRPIAVYTKHRWASPL
nr:MAG: hypothetical protein 3 [Leviviridae sp.]